MNEQKRPVPAAGEKRDERRPSGGQNGQGRSYAGKSADRRTDRPQGDAFRKDEKRPYGGKTASGPRKFDRDGQHRSQPSGNRSFDKKTDRPSYGRPASGKPSYGKPSFDKPSFGKPSYGKSSYGKPSGPRKPAAPAQPGARKLALKVLLDVHENGAYAALSLNKNLPRDLKPEERRLTTQLVYGTLENEVKIDHALNQLTEYPARDAVTRDALRLGVFQILFLERVPDSAAVDESVKLVKQMGAEASAGFVNAVLRNLIRQKDELSWPDAEKDPEEWLHVESSAPLWLVKKLIEAYGFDTAKQMLTYREASHPTTVRPNLLKLDDHGFEDLLRKKDLSFRAGVAPHAYLLEGVTEPGFDPDYQAGLYSIQGQSSMLAAEAVQARPGMKILDACAAPGGKSAYLCETMQLTGRVYAWELHEKRALMLDGVRRRLGLDNLRTAVKDACEYRPDMEKTLDAVLLDAPCSGTGVLSQKPDIKLRLKESDLPAIAETQKKLLNTVCRYVRPGGLLVYSTCSVLPEENKAQIEGFLKEHPEYTTEPMPLTFPAELRRQQDGLGLQLLGFRDQVEGFYIVRLRRNY